MKRSIHLILLTLFTSFVGYSQIIPFVSPLFTPYKGKPVVINQANLPNPKMIVAADSKETNEYKDLSVENRINFGVDIHYKEFISDHQNVTVVLSLKRWNKNGLTLRDTVVRLGINYSSLKDSFNLAQTDVRFSNSYKIEASLDSIYVNGIKKDTLPANLFLKSEILVNRSFSYKSVNALNFSSILGVDKDCDSETKIDHVSLVWPTNPNSGIIEYQIEWLHINDFSATSLSSAPSNPNSLAYNFKYNSTRISTTNNSYDLALIFNQGWLVFRIREVGVSSNGYFIYSDWSVPDVGFVGNVNTNSKFQITNTIAHNTSLNWQYAATYAEEGKKKEVISYFDGSLRNRQTVTQLNTDKNTIVAETIYDSQGRPAIQVLPVPVDDPACQATNPSKFSIINFYANFNQNTASVPKGYSARDFEIYDNTSSCNYITNGMGPQSGASKYYSSSNLNQQKAQAYVPKATNYPFTQIEYTKDNTGRIKRQSGVGPDFKIGSTHETKYLYGQPNQLELDMLFGSEVGYAAHYKKNVVVDANGQVSVSYLDQEERVIATALLGESPSSLVNIPSQLQNAKLLTVDAFNGITPQNQVSINGDAIVYSTSLLVGYVSDYKFSYNFTIPKLTDPCLPGICTECIYDLTYQLIDECGVDYFQNKYNKKISGKFSKDGNGNYNFNSCTPQYDSTAISEFTVNNLSIGNYQFNKILKINNDARQNYINNYLDSTKNTCLKTYSDFLQEELAVIDTSGCNMTCETCLAKLGKLEDFIANGLGTELEYNLHQQNCEKICGQSTTMNPCKVAFNMMVVDVSPNGQYGEYLDNNGTVNLNNFPLSIYKTPNSLANVGGLAMWKAPIYETSIGTNQLYEDDNGDSSKIYVTPNGANAWLPAITSGTVVKTDLATNQKYVYPQELLFVEDFIENFKNSWGKSLIFYHPEYCYYKNCLKFGEKINANDQLTSDSFDDLLLSTSTFEEAVTKKLLPSSYSGIFTNTNVPTGLNFQINWTAPVTNTYYSSSNSWDPFIYYGTNFSTVNCGNYGQKLAQKFLQYQEINGTYYSMPQIAAYLARCGSSLTSTPGQACFNFGGPIASNQYNVDILNSEWNIFKSLYLATKQKLKQELYDCKALTVCFKYCGCIGNEDYDPYSSGMINPQNFSNSLYFNQNQNCGSSLVNKFKAKKRRFPKATDVVSTKTANQAAYEVYLETGQCPIPFQFEALLKAIAESQQLDNNAVAINQHVELSTLLLAQNEFLPFGTVPTITQTVSLNTPTSLVLNWMNGNALFATVTLQKTTTTPWDDFVNITNLDPTSNMNFTAKAIKSDNSVTTITGTVTNFDLGPCTFANAGTTNQFGQDLQALMSALAFNGKLLQTNVDIDPLVVSSGSITGINGLQTILLQNAVNLDNSLTWTAAGTNQHFIINSSNFPVTSGLLITFTTYTTLGLFTWNNMNMVSYFTGMVSTGQHTFKITAHLTNGQTVLLNGSVYRVDPQGNSSGVNVGDYDLPIPGKCLEPEYERLKVLFDVLKDRLSAANYNVNQSINLYSSMYLENVITQQFNNTTNSTTSTYNASSDQLTIQLDNSCSIVLKGDLNHNLNQLVSIKAIHVVGNHDVNFNYHNFTLDVEYNLGNGLIQNGIVYGSTCLELKECKSCVELITKTNYVVKNEPALSSMMMIKEENIGSILSELDQLNLDLSDNTCRKEFASYLNCVYDFNNWVSENGDWCSNNNIEQISEIFNFPTFEASLFCHCAGELCARLQAIKDKITTFESTNDFLAYIDFNNLCKRPCEPITSPISPYIPRPTVQVIDPCIQMHLNQATFNAQLNYENYINNLVGDLIKKYNDHCLAVKEQSTYKYFDKSYHYTLYYYDQAGNLIKTVPPEGVRFKGFTSSSDPLAVQIQNDRVNHTKTVFMDHKLATRYEYNSLNQLVSQATPDADAASIFELNKPNGLHKELVTTKIQMVNESIGYLSGYLPATIATSLLPAYPERGCLYKTTDGGATWNNLGDLVASNFKKVIMLPNSSTGFAIGSDGIVLKSVDKGKSWDLMTTPWDNLAMMTQLNDIIAVSNQKIYIVGNNGLIATSTNLTSFTCIQVLSSVNLTSITMDATNLYVNALNQTTQVASIYSKLLTATDIVANWLVNTNFSAGIITALDPIAGSKVAMVGNDGRLFINNDVSLSSSTWDMVATNVSDNFKDVQFLSASIAYGLIGTKLFKSIDGGKTWLKISDFDFNHISESKDGSAVLAVGPYNKALLLTNSTSQSPINIHASVNNNDYFTAGWVDRTVVGSTSKFTVVLANGNKMLYSFDAAAANPTWNLITLPTTLVSSIQSILDIQLERTSPTANELRGVLLNSDKKMIRFFTNQIGNNTPQALYSSLSCQSLTIGAQGDGFIYLTDLLGNLRKLSYITPVAVIPTGLSTGNTAINCMLVSGSKLIYGGNTLLINRNLTTNVVEVQTTKTKSLALNSLTSYNGKPTALGNDGLIYILTNGVWVLTESQTSKNLYAGLTTNSNFYLAGETGYFKNGIITGNKFYGQNIQLTTGTPVEGTVNENLYAIVVSGAKMYVAGQNGKVLYSPTYTNSIFPFASFNAGSSDLFSLVSTSTKVIAVGSNSSLYDLNSANSIKNKNTYIPRVVDVHFGSLTEGSMLANGFTIRKTMDGGASWKMMKKNTANNPSNSNFSKVFTNSSNHTSYVFGTSQTMLSDPNNLFTPHLNTSLIGIKNYDQYQNNLYLLKSNAVLKLDLTTNTAVAYGTSISGVANAIAVRSNGSYAVVGDAGFFKYYNASGIVVFPTANSISTNKLNDIKFTDNSTFTIVGNNGTFIKSKNPTFDNTGNLTSALFDLVNLQTINLPQDVANTAIHINSISFSSATNAVFGGQFITPTSNATNFPYVRTVFDPRERYTARFYYDRLGRLVVSQNSRQYAIIDPLQVSKSRSYSYTLYDELGRVKEVGEKIENTTAGNRFNNTFGTYVSGYYNPNVLDDAKLNVWVSENTGLRNEVTKSYYDKSVITNLPTDFTPNSQTQRKRITHVTFESINDNNDQTFDHATHYDYDIHGNVKTLLQDNKKMGSAASLANQRFKRMDYIFDLVSGNVHRMSVQKGKIDQWHHAYRYDADNRIIAAYTNKNLPIIATPYYSQAMGNELNTNSDWQQEALYRYYEHGPLARVEIGKDKLQGIDYVYNLQGWMKGINASSLDQNLDPGKDGVANTANAQFSVDAAAFSLHYFTGDYAAINGTGQNHAASIQAGSTPTQYSSNNNLYNGNIRYMQTSLRNPTSYQAQPMLNVYQYDQLNRLKASRSFETGLTNNVWNSTSYANAYLNTFNYDANGNITSQVRHKRNGTKLDDLTYNYQKDGATTPNLISNRLYHVNDVVASTVDLTDIDNQGSFVTGSAINQSNNYIYDQEGRLIRDKQEKITIKWRNDGKIKEIVRDASETLKKTITFDYNAMGNRIAKHVKSAAGVLEKSTYYILDAQGNQLAMYEHLATVSPATYTLKERNIYGSSLLGVNRFEQNMFAATAPTTPQAVNLKHYTISNHLGNVLTVFSDKKVPILSGTTVIGYNPTIVSNSDYSPFGVELDGRTSVGSYRYGFQGQEMDDDVKGDGNAVNYKYRMHDPRLGRFFAVDPLFKDYLELTPYQFSSNSVICMIELEGKEGTMATYRVWNDDDGYHQQACGSQVIEGLKSNIVKTVMLPYGEPNGDPIHLKYKLILSNGAGSASIQYNYLNKPTVSEINDVFGNNLPKVQTKIEKSFTQKFNEMAPDFAKDGTMEAGDDGENSGGKYNGINGMRTAGEDMKLFGGVLGDIPNPFTQAMGKYFTGVGISLETTADFADPKVN
jgi:RHS repeat-associated protein